MLCTSFQVQVNECLVGVTSSVTGISKTSGNGRTVYVHTLPETLIILNRQIIACNALWSEVGGDQILFCFDITNGMALELPVQNVQESNKMVYPWKGQ